VMYVDNRTQKLFGMYAQVAPWLTSIIAKLFWSWNPNYRPPAVIVHFTVTAELLKQNADDYRTTVSESSEAFNRFGRVTGEERVTTDFLWANIILRLVHKSE
jgi:hypothetical protein